MPPRGSREIVKSAGFPTGLVYWLNSQRNNDTPVLATFVARPCLPILDVGDVLSFLLAYFSRLVWPRSRLAEVLPGGPAGIGGFIFKSHRPPDRAALGLKWSALLKSDSNPLLSGYRGNQTREEIGRLWVWHFGYDHDNMLISIRWLRLWLCLACLFLSFAISVPHCSVHNVCSSIISVPAVLLR